MKRHNTRLLSLPGYPLAELPGIKRRLIQEGRDVIDLGAGDNDMPPPAEVVAAMQEAVTDPAMSKYGFQQGLPEFRQSAVRYLERRFGIAIDPVAELLPMIGSKEGIAHLPFGLVEPGDVAVIPEPGYQAYLGGAVLAGAEPYIVPLRAENGFLLELDTLPKDVLQRAAIAYLNYPNNPTAAVAPREYLERAVATCRRYDIALVYDNAYCDLTFDGYEAPCMLGAAGCAGRGGRVLQPVQELLDDGLADRVRGRQSGPDRVSHQGEDLCRHGAVPRHPARRLGGTRPCGAVRRTRGAHSRGAAGRRGRQPAGGRVCGRPAACDHVPVDRAACGSPIL